MFKLKIENSMGKIGFNVCVSLGQKCIAFYCDKKEHLDESIKISKEKLLNDKASS